MGCRTVWPTRRAPSNAPGEFNACPRDVRFPLKRPFVGNLRQSMFPRSLSEAAGDGMTWPKAAKFLSWLARSRLVNVMRREFGKTHFGNWLEANRQYHHKVTLNPLHKCLHFRARNAPFTKSVHKIKDRRRDPTDRGDPP
jgi:hypothetical protein